MPPLLRFTRRHRIDNGFAVREADGRILVGASDHRRAVWGIALWMLFIDAIGLAFLAFGGFAELIPVPLPVVGLLSLVPTLSIPAITYLAFQHEFNKGPVLEVDESRRALTLPRDGIELGFDRVAEVAVLAGNFRMSDGELQPMGELSLLVADPAGREPEVVPVVLVPNVTTLDGLADRLAALLDVPVRREVQDAVEGMFKSR